VDDERKYLLILSCLRVVGVAYITAAVSQAPQLTQLLIAAALAALAWELRSLTPSR
jgi:hypothetical protein